MTAADAVLVRSNVGPLQRPVSLTALSAYLLRPPGQPGAMWLTITDPRKQHVTDFLNSANALVLRPTTPEQAHAAVVSVGPPAYAARTGETRRRRVTEGREAC